MRRLLLLLLLLAVAGCRRDTVAADGKVHLEFWTLQLKPDYTDYVQSLMDRYEKLHPNINLTWLDAPIDVILPKMMASIAGGVSPDVVNLNSENAIILAGKSALVSMDETVPAAAKGGYFPGLWNAARYEGVNYAVPWYVTLQVNIYNADIFRQAGLDPDRPPRTYDEVAQYAAQIHQRTSSYGYMPLIKFLDDLQLHDIPILSPDRKRAVFNSPAAVARLQWYVDLFHRDIVPRETLVRGYQGAVDRYQSGDLGMLFTGPQFLKKVKANAPSVYAVSRVAPLPDTPTGMQAAATMDFVVPRASRHRAEAVDLALFLTNDENQLEFCKRAPILPSRIASARDTFFTARKVESLDDQAILISLRELPKARDLSLGMPHFQDLSRALGEALEASLLGHKSAQQALDDCVASWNQVLAATTP